MDFTSSRICLVDHEMINAGFEGPEGFCSMDCDWESCSNHSSNGSSSSSPPPSSSSPPPSSSSSSSSSSLNGTTQATESCSCGDSQVSHHNQNQNNHHHHHHHHQQKFREKHVTFPSQHDPRQSVISGDEEEVMFYHSTKALWDSLNYITSMKDMCDVIFYVGRTRHPLYGVKSLLSVRSRVMYLRILHAQRTGTSAPRKSAFMWRRARPADCATVDGRVQIDVMDYDVTVFSHLIDFLHSGRVRVDATTVLGLYCAAVEFEVPDLSRACWDFVERCALRGHTHSVLASGTEYLGRKALDKLSRKFLRI